MWDGIDGYGRSGKRGMSTETTSENSTDIELSDASTVHSDGARLATLSVGHAVIDSYGHTLLAPMFPLIKERLSLSLGQIGALPLIMGLTASLAQPLIGWLTDRWPRVPAVALGPAVAAVFIGLISFSPSYAFLAACLFGAGIGIGAYHPQGASLASQAARGRGLAMSAFTVGGNIGFGVAPVLGALYFRNFGLDRFYWASVPGILFAVWMLAVLRQTGNGYLGGSGASSRARHGRWDPVALGLLTGTVAVRAGVQIATSAFMAFLLQSRWSNAAAFGMNSTEIAGASLSIYLLATAISGPIGGHLSDLFGRRTIMFISLALAPLVFHAALRLSGWYLVVGLAAGGFVLMLPHPSNVVMAQEYMPHSAGMAASMITGVAWAMGQFLVWPLGAFAERFGVETALRWVYWLPVLGLALVIPLKEPRAGAVAAAGE
jgi:FSR family fosmidomycin resistance protein-like MFS transporter